MHIAEAAKHVAFKNAVNTENWQLSHRQTLRLANVHTYIYIQTHKFILHQKWWQRIWGAGTGWLDGKGRLKEMEF